MGFLKGERRPKQILNKMFTTEIFAHQKYLFVCSIFKISSLRHPSTHVEIKLSCDAHF